MSDTAAAISKRLALFLDGTWNTVSSNTNVWRLKSLTAPSGSDGRPQQIYYDAGLGTTMGEIVRGGVFGYGVDEAVINAYEWLIEHYEPGDEIFVFGFSRGAYTARSLSGFVSRCGLLAPGAPLSIRQLYERYKRGNDVLTIHQLRARPDNSSCKTEEKWMLKFSREVPVKFTGVWDTVGALSGSTYFALITGGNHDFLDTNLRRSEEFVFHALAIDEHRKAFSPTLFTKFDSKDGTNIVPERTLDQVEQRWFVGAHANVGGGVDNDLLSQIPLKWMMTKAAFHGLTFRNEGTIEEDVNTSPIEDSFAEMAGGTYKAIEFGIPFYREIAAPPEERSITMVHTINETIDASVFNYWHHNADYRPKNLARWADTHGVKIEDLKSSVRADKPQTTVPD